MLIKEKKYFAKTLLKERIKISTNDFISKYITPFEKKIIKWKILVKIWMIIY